ncbi:MAG: sulfotransferase domain-containing protein [Candidatus Paceibacterota bacterium]
MKSVEKVIYIGSVARSGSSWVGQILNSSEKVIFKFQPLFSYEFKDIIDEDSTKDKYVEFFQDLANKESTFLDQTDKVEAGIYPKFKKSTPDTLVFKENRYQSIIEPMIRRNDNLLFVGIIRNPCAVINSWRKNAKEFPSGSNIKEEWRFGNCKNKGNEDYFGYYKWKEVANNYHDLKKKYKDRVFLIHYDRFVENPETITNELFNFLGMNISSQTKNFIEESTSKTDDNYYSVYKGQERKKKWMEELDPYIISEIEADLRDTRLERYLY